MKKRIPAIIILAAMLLSMGSCGSGGNGNNTDTTATNDTTTDAAATTDYIDTLGEKDFGGKTYTIIAAPNNLISILNMQSGEITGEVLNDEQYNRDKAVEKRYNVVIDYPAADPDNTDKMVTNAGLAGDFIGNIYIDALCEGTSGMSSVFTQGSLMNLLDLPYLQLDKEWWSSLTYKNLQYNGKMFYTSGDLAINSFIGAGCVYMNTNLAEKYGVDENALYKKVYDGTWTIDELYSITKDMDLDLNNDGKMDCVNDFYGLVLESNTLTSNLLLTSCGVHLCDTDPDTGNLTVNLGIQNVVSIIDKLANEFQLIDNAGDNTNLYDKNFKLDKSLFAIHYVESSLRRFRDMESDYVIYPMPKYSAGQESYVSFLNPWVKAFIAAPIVQEDKEMTGFITEVLEYMTVRDVRPAVIDITLKGKALRNDDSIAMLDLIFDTTYIDFNGIYNFGNSLGVVNNAIFNDKPYASSYAKIESKMNGALDDFMSMFE